MTNGEYAPPPQTSFEREVARRAREAVDTNARRANVTRRDFLRSACAMATMLLVVDGCSKERAAVDRRRPGGEFGSTLPPESTVEPDVAADALAGGDGFVFDVQGHMLDFEVDPLSRRELGFTGNFPQASCGEADHAKCFDAEVGRREGRYSPSSPRGVDRLIASVEGAGIGRPSNVYAELGTTWSGRECTGWSPCAVRARDALRSWHPRGERIQADPATGGGT